MLKFKERFFVSKLISYKELLITKEEKKELTVEDVAKIQFIYENFEFKFINWSFIKKFTLSQLQTFLCYQFKKLEDLETLLMNDYNIKEFVTEILQKNRGDFGIYISRMIKLNYKIEQINFIIKNEMYFEKYHDMFDYDEFVEKVSKLGFDHKIELVTNCSINFLEFIRKLYSITECYVLIATKKIIEFEFSEKELLEFIKLCHSNGFSVYEIYTLMSLDKVCECGFPLDFEFLREEIKKGKDKEKILDEQIENLIRFQ